MLNEFDVQRIVLAMRKAEKEEAAPGCLLILFWTAILFAAGVWAGKGMLLAAGEFDSLQNRVRELEVRVAAWEEG